MRVRNLFLLIVLLPFAIACRKQSDAFVLHGTVDAADSIPILVTGLDSRYDRIDTIRPENGSFTYVCETDTVTPLLILFSDGRRDIVFAAPQLEATYERSLTDSMATVSGGIYNEEYREFVASLSEGNYIDCIDTLVRRDPSSEVVPYLLYEYSMSPDASDKRILDIIELMSGQMLDNIFVSDLKRDASEVSRFNGILTTMNLRDTLMQKVRITDICKSGHMLVCVWASWDEASRKAHRELAGLAEEYKKKDFHLAGISLDANADRWMEAVKEDSLDWSQYCDQGGWGGRLVQQTTFDELPFYIVLAPSGRIISRNTDLTAVKTRLDEVLKDKKK